MNLVSCSPFALFYNSSDLLVNHLIYKIGSNEMKTEIDLLKLCGIVGIEAIQKMFDAHMINREQLEHVYYMFKQANNETYKIIVKSFNDGNNEFEEIVYINPNNVLDTSYQHTQGGTVTIEQVLNNKDKFIADKMLSALKTVFELRSKFNMKCTDIKCAMLILNNQIREV